MDQHRRLDQRLSEAFPWMGVAVGWGRVQKPFQEVFERSLLRWHGMQARPQTRGTACRQFPWMWARGQKPPLYGF